MQPAIKTAVGYFVTQLSETGIATRRIVKIIVCVQRDVEILAKHVAHHSESSATRCGMSGWKFRMIRCWNISGPGRVNISTDISNRTNYVELVFIGEEYLSLIH